jgi:hypothetical protein
MKKDYGYQAVIQGKDGWNRITENYPLATLKIVCRELVKSGESWISTRHLILDTKTNEISYEELD